MDTIFLLLASTIAGLIFAFACLFSAFVHRKETKESTPEAFSWVDEYID